MIWQNSEFGSGILHGKGKCVYPFVIMKCESEKYMAGFIVKEFLRTIGEFDTIEQAKQASEAQDYYLRGRRCLK